MTMAFLGMDFGCAFDSLYSGKFPDKDCLLPLISKLLGYAIVAASTTVKVPQIMKILNHRSIRGLSVVSFELEVIGYTIALAYCLHQKLPFSAYGELAFLLIQAIILVAVIYNYSQPLGMKTWVKALMSPSELEYVLHYGKIVKVRHVAARLPLRESRSRDSMGSSLDNDYNSSCRYYNYSQPLGMKIWVKTLVYSAVAPTILAGQIDPILFEALYASQHAIFLFARIPQIWQNFSNKSTGELSFLTCLMNSAGSMVRVFTSFQEKAPLSVLLGYSIGIVTNGTILSQIALYRKAHTKKERKAE